MKRSIQRFINSNRFAIRKEVAENLAATFMDWEDGFRKESGDLNIKQVLEMRDDGIAVIHIDGALANRNTIEAYWYDQDTYQSIGDAFEEAANDPNVLGIVLEIDSPGGIVNGVSDLAAKIYGHRGQKPFGIVAHSAGEMCSAAYWIGSAAEKIYASDNASLGSIGVLCVFRKSKDETVTVVRSNLSPNKAPTPETAEGRSQIEKELDALASVFINTVAQNRGVDYETVLNDFGQGAVFVGRGAVKAGLADDVMSLEDVIYNMKNTQNGGSMPNPTAQKGAEIDVEALQKSAAEAERARIKGINAAFAGLGLEADAQSFIDDGKSVAEAKDFAFDAMRSALAKANEEIKALKDAKPTAAAASEEQKKAMELLEEASAESKQVQGGARSEDEAADADILAGFKAGAKSREVK